MRVTASPSSLRTPWSIWVFFALVFVPYTCVYPYLDDVNNPNENVRLYMTMALVEQETFRIDAFVDRYGWVNDMARRAGEDGLEHDYSLKAPGTSYAGVPFYWAFAQLATRYGHPIPTIGDFADQLAWWKRSATFVVRLFVVQLPSFAFLVWFERWLRRVTSDVVFRLSAVAAIGLGTTYFAYSLMFVGHTLSAVVTFVSFGLLASEWTQRSLPRRRVSCAFLAGLFAGLATLLEYQAFPLTLLLALFSLVTFRRLRPLLAFALGAVPSALALMIFQWRCFGSPFAAGHLWAENNDFAELHRQGFYGLTGVDWGVFRALSVDRTFGFFATSPFMALSVLALVALVVPSIQRRLRTPRFPLLVALVMMLTLWLAISSALNWRGGWTVGPRLLGVAPPFFAFGAVAGLEWAARFGPWLRVVLRGLAGGFALAGACTLGLVSMVYNSVPEDILRPLLDFAWPLARLGFVPYHAGDFVGLHSAFLFWIPVASAFGATLVSLLVSRENAAPMILRLLMALMALEVGMVPAFTRTSAEAGVAAADLRKEFSRKWLPRGRDAVAVLRARAEEAGRDRDSRAPCLWLDASNIERSLGWVEEADRDLQLSIGKHPGWTSAEVTDHCH
jgi:hypothetical protein